jgi:hypothetical protein
MAAKTSRGNALMDSVIRGIWVSPGNAHQILFSFKIGFDASGRRINESWKAKLLIIVVALAVFAFAANTVACLGVR